MTGGYAGGTRGVGATAGTICRDLTSFAPAQLRHSPEAGSGAPHLMHLDTRMPPDGSRTLPSAKPSVQMKKDRQRHDCCRLRSKLRLPEAYRQRAEPAQSAYLASLEAAFGPDEESDGRMVG